MIQPVVQRTLHSANASETRAIGARLGAQLQGGEIIALQGDLGAGKTTLVQGLLQGMGSRDRVTSPTFTLVNVYRAGALEVHHLDAYRLGMAGNTSDAAFGLGIEDVLGASDVVVVIEWAEIASALDAAATLHIRMVADEGSDQRTLTFTASDPPTAALLDAL